MTFNVWWCIRNAIDAKLKFWSQPKFFARGINYLFIYWSFGSVRLFICLRVFLVSCWRCFVILPPLFQTLRCWRGQISWKTQNKNQKKKHSNSFQSCSCAVLVCVCVCLLRWFHRVYHKSVNIMLVVRNGALVSFCFSCVFLFSRTNQPPVTRKKTTELTNKNVPFNIIR